ncbi:hypothetical protein HJFPF1_05893 [Paramyrothecium foliicola]|nr:hypothetical protein HJFPF1_05893 [Paramyrothecium foliicola]
MDALPQSIHDEIASLMDGAVFQRPTLATVSHKWQAAIERQTFRKIRLKSSELAHESVRGRFECEEDRRINDEAFTAAFTKLFNILQSWDPSTGGHIELVLRDVYSVTDHDFLRISSQRREGYSLLGFAGPGTDNLDTASSQELDLWSWRHIYSQLELSKPELPTVPVVGCFWIAALTTRKVSPSAASQIMIKLPNIKEVELRLHDDELRYTALRRIRRQNLEKAICRSLSNLSNLRTLVISMVNLQFWSPTWGLANLNFDDHSTSDSLSKKVYFATANLDSLKDLAVKGPLDTSIFGPAPTKSLPGLFWQNLENLHIQFAMRHPLGGSYFQVLLGSGSFSLLNVNPFVAPLDAQMPPGYDDIEDEDILARNLFSPSRHFASDGFYDCNVAPRDHLIEPLFMAFGRACLQMRALRSAQLTCDIPLHQDTKTNKPGMPRYSWGVTYLSTGSSLKFDAHKCPIFFENPERRRLFWTVQHWRPSMQLKHLLRQIGQERSGGAIFEKFLSLKEVLDIE